MGGGSSVGDFLWDVNSPGSPEDKDPLRESHFLMSFSPSRVKSTNFLFSQMDAKLEIVELCFRLLLAKRQI